MAFGLSGGGAATVSPTAPDDWKQSVRAATTAAGTLASSFENGDSVDGVSLVTGNRILIKNQAAGAENGIYTVNASGAPTRANDYTAGISAASTIVIAEEGTTNADMAFQCTNNVGSDVVGTDALVFAAFGIANGGSDQLASFDANTAVFPATAPAAATSRNEHPLIAYDDTTDENVIFQGLMSRDYSAGSLMVDLNWIAASATTGNVKWNVAFERLAAGGQDLDADGFAAVQTGTSTTNGTSGVITKTSITFTQAQADAIAASDAFRLKVTRDADDGGDTMVGDAQLLRVQIRQ